MTKLLQIPFYYVRHGQTDWNIENRCMGQQDVPLNESGIAQAIACRKSLVNCGITTICHSPLIRAKQTAEILNETLGCHLKEIEELKEFNLGPYQGQLKTEWFHDWKSGKLLEGTEPYSDFIHRCLDGINKAINEKGVILIVAHGGVYWAIQHFAQIERKDLPNCAPAFHLPLEDNQWEVTLLN